jgi:Arc/MetJ-type ribon-helix-helix transcriptional regulator
MKLVSIYLPEPYIRELDVLVEKERYPNRSEAIRLAIHDLLKTEVWSLHEAEKPK